MREKKAVSVCVFVYVCARGTSWALCSLCQKEAKSTRKERGQKEKRRQEERRSTETSVPPVSGDKDGVARACDEL